ncbi:hypothetical protein [Isoptericola sp. BMS4]|uniref:hypothetical protein n=1 Tax=Isoptericola sp. BMS4 TaxID=2527875 RepID=UPI00141DB489|nr:hypothetical protein [Isoptericola sp. BMS4]
MTATSLDPAALLSGPRGRRLCLELAQLLDDEVYQAVFHASYDLDPGAGTSVVMFGPGTEARPRLTPADVVRRLDAVPLADLDERVVLAALVEMVATARYWQEPDGPDVLAAMPEVSAALGRVAEHLVSTACVGWWSDPVPAGADREVVWHEDGRPDTPSGMPDDVDGLLAAWRTDAVEDELRAVWERPADPTAGWGGIWWSAPPRELQRSTRDLGTAGPVGLWLVEDSFGWERATVRPVVPAPGARVLTVDGPDDWADLCRRHPLVVTASRRHDWYRTTGRDGAWVQPDWSAVAGEADAVHLTVRGYVTTAGLPVPVADGVASVLAGWDPDATYWFAAASPAPGAVEGWWYDQDGDSWRRDGT